jgi:pimeloyl-ACP methyl ester carboxylesterase
MAKLTAADRNRICAENEGGRSILAINGYGNANTAAYFAREAAHYARLVLDPPAPPRRFCDTCGAEKPYGQSCGCLDNGGQ